MKKIFSLVIAFILLTAFCLTFSACEFFEGIDFTVDDFSFAVFGKKDMDARKAVVRKYHGADEHVVIPETVEHKGIIYTVTQLKAPIEMGTSPKFWEKVQVKSITLNKSMDRTFHVLAVQCSTLEEIRVDAENTFYTSIEGVLFSKDLSYIVMYPAGRKGASYEVPYGVSLLPGLCFSFTNVSTELKEIILPSTVTRIEAAFRDLEGIKVYIPSSVTEIAVSAFNRTEPTKPGVEIYC